MYIFAGAISSLGDIPAEIDKTDFSHRVHLSRQRLRFFHLRSKCRDTGSRLQQHRRSRVPVNYCVCIKPAEFLMRRKAANGMDRLRTSGRLGIGPESVGRRATTFAVVVVFHICTILLFVLSKHADQPRQKQGSLSVFAVAASPSPPAVQLPDPVIPVEAIAVISSAAEAHAEQQAAQGDPDGQVCSPVDEVSSQLANDPLVPLAIGRVARSDRSISEAIVMWNAEWSAASATDDAPMADVRERVVTILQNLPPDCLAAPVTGPRLIAIAEQGYTTFLAFGSGEWSWQELIEPADDMPSGDENVWSWEELFAENTQTRSF